MVQRAGDQRSGRRSGKCKGHVGTGVACFSDRGQAAGWSTVTEGVREGGEKQDLG